MSNLEWGYIIIVEFFMIAYYGAVLAQCLINCNPLTIFISLIIVVALAILFIKTVFGFIDHGKIR